MGGGWITNPDISVLKLFYIGGLDFLIQLSLVDSLYSFKHLRRLTKPGNSFEMSYVHLNRLSSRKFEGKLSLQFILQEESFAFTLSVPVFTGTMIASLVLIKC